MTQEMKKYNYLIIGGGMSADQAVAGIRSIDKKGSIAMISADVDEPYAKPALSKKLWVDSNFHDEDIDFHTAEKFDATIMLETTVTKIDIKNHIVETNTAEKIAYDKLLLATGSTARSLTGEKSDRVIALRTKQDYLKIRKFSGNNKHVIVVGNGYIGSEIAAGLIQSDTKVTFVITGKRIFDKKFPAFLSEKYEQRYLNAGMKIYHESKVTGYELIEKGVKVFLDNGDVLESDGLVLGIGADSNSSLASDAGIKVDEYGVVVDEHLQTSIPGIWAAGDIISYPDKILGQQSAGHVRHAIQSGLFVGKQLAGEVGTYDYTPVFYSWVFDINWEAVGKVDSKLKMYSEKLGDEKFVIYYFENDNLVGILSWSSEVNMDHFKEMLKKSPSINDLQKVLEIQKID
ncbi:NAD(P)/FAD-dependent oxidoreductase [Liquorilactobacillus cacaonum]|uniref:Putidaredoxin reductase n=1 Tax=Liquorilactobacillus cacaonum DSM 21116 TaxID=1423729 RepID=A0A0R2CL09_9LACO|nr:NAD(P)/FAD-dependent oxidoreductase [Liquorilactobacillus cacaonum]KRM91978.1 putidaredoxin reductase [Liquorilactobacillus cacaonum DSM 21116]